MRRLSISVLLLLLAACGSSSSPSSDGGSDAGSDAGVDAGPLHANLIISGDPDEGLGIFDPSVVYAADAGSGTMVYSVVAPEQEHVHTRIASSSDQGKTWTYLGEVNQALAATVTTTDSTICGQTSCSGAIIHEVASLIIDPSDSADRLYKVFTHSYFANFNASNTVETHVEIGMLTLYTAAAATGPWTAAPLIGWNSSSPSSSTGTAQNANTDATLSVLSHCVVLTEPGALLRGSTIDLALGCAFISNGAPAIEIDLVRSTDHAHTFHSVSTLLSASDATALGSNTPQINAADLFQIGSQTYLFATPGGTVAFPGGGTGSGYRGCLTIPVSDLDAGTVARTAGIPTIATSVLGASQQFIGACTAAEGAPALGVAGDVLALSPPLFGMFSTGRAAP